LRVGFTNFSLVILYVLLFFVSLALKVAKNENVICLENVFTLLGWGKDIFDLKKCYVFFSLPKKEHNIQILFIKPTLNSRFE
jgi:hypothetical protein